MSRQPTRRYRTVSRSVHLFRAFLKEQTEPEYFYRELARDTIALLSHYEPLRDRLVLDVGSGPVQFAEEFAAAGSRYIGLDHDPDAIDRMPGASAVIATGTQLPFADGSIDVVMSSNVMEHVRRPAELGGELMRVVRPGGLVFIGYTAWYSPWGGHETSPWHYLGGDFAARRYARTHGRPPKNRFGESMFATHVSDGLRWAQSQQAGWLIEAAPRYHPDWAAGLVAVPGLRELTTWNLMMVLRRR